MGRRRLGADSASSTKRRCFGAYRQAAYGTLPYIQTSALSASQVTSLPVSPAAFGAGAPLTETITFDRRPTYILQYNLKLQREFFGTVLEVAYVGLRGVNFFGQGDFNTGIPQILLDGRSLFTGNEPFRNPNFSTIRSAIQGFSSNYNGLNLSAKPDDQALRIEGRRSKLEG